jgi:hypothetical protein
VVNMARDSPDECVSKVNIDELKEGFFFNENQ